MKKLHRFIGNYQLGQGTMRIDDDELAHQMRSVLKLLPGEMVVIGDGQGNEAQCRIISYDYDVVLLEGLSVGRNATELPGRTILYCAVLKNENFELAAAKATEVGISEIVPLVTKRTVKLNLKLERVQKIVREAAELAGRGLIPTIQPLQEFERVLVPARKNDVNFFFDPSGQPFHGVAASVRQAGVFIGPEGGWEEDELEAAKKVGMRIVSLGGLIMRAETAATIGSFIVVHRMK